MQFKSTAAERREAVYGRRDYRMALAVYGIALLAAIVGGLDTI